MNRYLSFVTVCLTIIAGAEVATILTSITPLQATRDELWSFFIFSWLLLAGTGTFAWHFIKQKLVYRTRNVSFFISMRQASLVAALIILAGFFNSLRILTLWDMLPLAFSALLIEFFFQADTLPASRRHEPTPRG